MEKNIMEKMQKKLTDLISNGYGINQAMGELGLKKNDVVALMQEDEETYKKLQKRYNIDWIQEVKFTGEKLALTDSDTPELAALKAEAKELGVEFNPQIGYDKLKNRLDEFKAQQAEETTQTPEA